MNLPIIRASSEGNQQEVKRLIRNGADLEATEEGYTALHMAAMKGHAVVVALLLKNKANPEAQGRNKMTPLLAAVSTFEGNENQRAKIVRSLVEYKANPNAEDKLGNSALYFCAIYNRLKTAATLVKLGAIPEPVAICAAKARGYITLVERLERIIEEREILKRKEQARLLKEKKNHPLYKYRPSEEDMKVLRGELLLKEIKAVDAFLDAILTRDEENILEKMDSPFFKEFLKTEYAGKVCLPALQAAAEANFPKVALRIMTVESFQEFLNSIYRLAKLLPLSVRRFIEALQIAIETRHVKVFENILANFPPRKEKPPLVFLKKMRNLLELIGELDEPRIFLSILKLLKQSQILKLFGMKFMDALEKIFLAENSEGKILKIALEHPEYFEEHGKILKMIFGVAILKNEKDLLSAVIAKLSKDDLISITNTVKEEKKMLEIMELSSFKEKMTGDDLADFLISAASSGWEKVADHLIEDLWSEAVDSQKLEDARQAAQSRLKETVDLIENSRIKGKKLKRARETEQQFKRIADKLQKHPRYPGNRLQTVFSRQTIFNNFMGGK